MEVEKGNDDRSQNELNASYIEKQNDMEVAQVLADLSRKVSISESPVENNDNALGGKITEQETFTAKESPLGSGKGDEGSKLDKNASHTSQIPEIPRSVYKCNCGECFEKSAELAAHKRWTCLLVVKRLQCDICKSRFAHEHGLRRHMKQLHKGDFSCSHCNLKFHNKIKLTRHWMEFHYDDSKGDKLKCFFCGDDSFNSKFDLESHLLVHKYNKSQARMSSKPHRQDSNDCIDLTGMLHTVNSTSGSSLHNVLKYGPSSVTATHTEVCSDSNTPSQLGSSHSHSQQNPGLQQQMPHWQGINVHGAPKTPASGSSRIATSAPPHVAHSHSSHHHSSIPLSTFCHIPLHQHHSLQAPLPPQTASRLSHHRHPPPPPPPPHHHHHPHPHPSPASHHYHPQYYGKAHHPPDPSTSTPFFHRPPFWEHLPGLHHHSPFFKKFCKGKHHHNKWKWKKRYFKHMMGQSFSPVDSSGCYPQYEIANQYKYSHPQTIETPSVSNADPVPSTTNTVPPAPDLSEADSEYSGQTSSTSFKMICNFCNQVIEKGKAMQHRRQDCPYICAFKCNVCGKMFRKQHRLLQHMSTACHDISETDNNSIPTSASFPSDSPSVSNLQKQLNSVLDFQKTPSVSETNSMVSKSKPKVQHLPASVVLCSRMGDGDFLDPGPKSVALSKDSLALKEPIMSQKLPEVIEIDDDEGEDESCDSDIEEQSLMIADRNPSVSSSLKSPPLLQCAVCRTKFDSINMLSLHLQSHITHVTAVLKVHEWKERSIQYFSDSENEKGDSSEFSVGQSTLLTDASSQDTNSIYATTSVLSTIESSSLKADTITESEKWLKPHCKKKEKKKDRNEMFSCDHCNESFSFRKSFSRHMKTKHPEIKQKLECPVCHKKFSWKKRGQFYERHLSSHYGVTVFKYKCEICDKTFLEQSKLRAHMAVQHGKAEELLHKCQVCGKTYGTKSSLTRHLRSHSGERPHQCSLCHESFLEKRELTRHMANHTGQPAFECVHCGQGFTLKTSLDTHMKRKHAQPPPTS